MYECNGLGDGGDQDPWGEDDLVWIGIILIVLGWFAGLLSAWLDKPHT